jgi:hypothetical protein
MLLDYVSSKGGIVGFCALAHESGRTGSRSTHCPGAFPTDAEKIHPDPEVTTSGCSTDSASSGEAHRGHQPNLVVFLSATPRHSSPARRSRLTAGQCTRWTAPRTAMPGSMAGVGLVPVSARGASRASCGHSPGHARRQVDASPPARVRTGTGFGFDVVVDQGFDIGRCEHSGKLSWLSAADFAGPWF